MGSPTGAHDRPSGAGFDATHVHTAVGPSPEGDDASRRSAVPCRGQDNGFYPRHRVSTADRRAAVFITFHAFWVEWTGSHESQSRRPPLQGLRATCYHVQLRPHRNPRFLPGEITGGRTF